VTEGASNEQFVELAGGADGCETMLCPASEEHPRCGEGSVIALADGNLLAAYSEFDTADRGDYGAAHVRGKTPRDRGRTWSAPLPLVENDAVTAFSVSLLRPPSGRILAPVAVMEPRGQQAPYHCRSTCFFSDDEGQSWKRSQTTLDLDAVDGLQEPAVVELNDGALMMFMRTSLGHQYRSVSRDQGQTWS